MFVKTSLKWSIVLQQCLGLQILFHRSLKTCLLSTDHNKCHLTVIILFKYESQYRSKWSLCFCLFVCFVCYAALFKNYLELDWAIYWFYSINVAWDYILLIYFDSALLIHFLGLKDIFMCFYDFFHLDLLCSCVLMCQVFFFFFLFLLLCESPPFFLCSPVSC